MVVLMRLVDRKYPHIGRYFPLRHWRKKQPWEPVRIKETQQFYKSFADPRFLLKPILNAQGERHYDGGNEDFQGRYELRFAPYIFEPTYEDDYVNGYGG